MTSKNAVEQADSIESRILDAALVQFEQVGIKKTTIEDIARRAGVDRVTVYRRVGSRDDVVQIVATREVGRVLAEMAAIPERHDTLDDLVADMFVTVITLWRKHALVERLLTLEPDRLLPQLTTDGGPTFTMAVAATASAMQRAADNGLLADSTDLLTRAEILCRFVHSLILQPDSCIPLDTTAELDAFARKFLVPIISA